MESKFNISNSKEARLLLGLLQELDSTFPTKMKEYEIISKVKDDLIKETSAGEVAGIAKWTAWLSGGSTTSIREAASRATGSEYAYIPQEKLDTMLIPTQIDEKIAAIGDISTAIHEAVKDLSEDSSIDELLVAINKICNMTIAPGSNQDHINKYFANATVIQEVYLGLNASQRQLFDTTFNRLVKILRNDKDFTENGKYFNTVLSATPICVYALDVQYPTRIAMLGKAFSEGLKKLKDNNLDNLSPANLEVMLQISVMLESRLQKIAVDLTAINDAATGKSKPGGL